MGYFEVDREGLAKLIANRGKEFVIFELLQNAWDQKVTEVKVEFTKEPGRPLARIEVVDDDPNGFSDLSHAYTLFAESEKKDNPEQRGRWNLGEKLVLALCRSATISTTKGTVQFTKDGERINYPKKKMMKGSSVIAYIKMNTQEFKDVLLAVHTLIPPDIPTIFNGQPMEQRIPITTFEATLPTVKADAEGNLRPTKRKTIVSIYEPRDGEKPMLYEMGIPVVEFDRFHADVGQKIPLNMDRDNVTPAYKRELRALVLANSHDHMSEDDSAEAWVSDAMEHPTMEQHPEAVDVVLTDRYGKKRAIYDPSDPEANNRLVSKGYKLIHGRSFGKSGWGTIRTTGKAEASGMIDPTKKPYSDDPNAPTVEVLPQSKYTKGMLIIKWIAKILANRLMDVDITVRIVIPPVTTYNWGACYGHKQLDLNRNKLGKKWFDENRTPEKVLELLLHEFGHEYEMNHLSNKFHDAIARLGSKLAILLSKEPEIINDL